MTAAKKHLHYGLASAFLPAGVVSLALIFLCLNITAFVEPPILHAQDRADGLASFDDSKKELQDRNDVAKDPDREFLSELEFPIPAPRPQTLDERIAAMRMTEDLVVVPEVEPIRTAYAEALDEALVRSYSRELFLKQVKSGRFATNRAPISDEDFTPEALDRRLLMWTNHAVHLLVQYRLGVPQTEYRMKLAKDALIREVRSVLAPWRKSNSVLDLPAGHLGELLGFTLQILEADALAVKMNESKSDVKRPHTRAAKNVIKLDRESKEFVSLCVRALEEDIVYENELPGWRRASGEVVRNSMAPRLATPSSPATISALLGLSSAMRMGVQIKDATVYQRMLGKWRHFQSTAWDQDPVGIRLLRPDKRTNVLQEKAVSAIPRGWAGNYAWTKDPSAGPDAPKQKRDKVRSTDLVSTPQTVCCLLLARELAIGAKQNPYKDITKEEFDKCVNDGFAWCILNLTPANYEEARKTEGAFYLEREYWYALHTLMTLTGNRVLGKVDWHQWITNSASNCKSNFPDMSAELARINSQYGAAPDEAEAKKRDAELLEYLKTRGQTTRVAGILSAYPMTGLVLVARFAPIVTPPTPTITGGGKSADTESANGKRKDGDPGKDGEKKSDDNPSSPKEPNKAGADAG